MTRRILLLLLLLSLGIGGAYSQDWESIKNKTWLFEKEFAGFSIVFYETTTNELKAICQMQGSGLCVTLTTIYEVTINDESIQCAQLDSSSRTEGLPRFKFDSKAEDLIDIRNGEKARLLSNKPIVRKRTCEIVPIGRLENETITEDILNE